MKLKTQIKIYQTLVTELGGKYNGAEDFINTRVKELCLEHGILEEEVRLYIFVCCTYSLVTNAVKKWVFFALKIVLILKCRAYKKLKEQIFCQDVSKLNDICKIKLTET